MPGKPTGKNAKTPPRPKVKRIVRKTSRRGQAANLKQNVAHQGRQQDR